MARKHKLTVRDGYLEMAFGGELNFEDISLAIAEELVHPAFVTHNDIWIFGPEMVSLRFEDLNTITSLIAEGYPADATRTRTALVIPPGFNSGVANMWLQTTHQLPYEIRIFERLEDAERWIGF